MSAPSPVEIRDALHRNDNVSMRFIFEEQARYCLDFLTTQTDCTRQQAEGLFIDAMLVLREQILREEVSTFVALREQLLHILLSLYNRHLNEEGYHQDVSEDLLANLREHHPTLQWTTLANPEKQKLQIRALEAFNDLEEQHRLVLHYYYVRHWTLSEICEKFDIPSEDAANTVKLESYEHWLRASAFPEGRSRQHTQLILAFIDGKPGPRHKEAFESLLSDTDFQLQIQMQLAMIESIRGVDRAAAADDFYNILGDLLHPGISEQEQKKRQRFALAGLALVLVGMVALWLWPSQGGDTWFVPYPGPQEGLEGYDQELQASFVLYNEGRYEQALNGLIEIAIDDPNANELELMVGSCYLSTDKALLAIPWFKQLQRSSNPQLRDDGAWYLALAYHDVGMDEKSVQIMRQLADSSGSYKEAALALLQEWTIH